MPQLNRTSGLVREDRYDQYRMIPTGTDCWCAPPQQATIERHPVKKVLTIALLASVLALLLLPGTVQAATRPTTAEKQVIALVNQERAKYGLAPVRFHATLTRAARAHSREMARRGVLTHRSANGATVAQRLIRFGYKRSGFRSWSIGENIARARSGSLLATPTGIVYLWMNSTAHRKVILKGSFRDVGVGIAKSESGMRYFTLDMGRRIR
jgi:uncharacterized protein YkwD